MFGNCELCLKWSRFVIVEECVNNDDDGVVYMYEDLVMNKRLSEFLYFVCVKG